MRPCQNLHVFVIGLYVIFLILKHSIGVPEKQHVDLQEPLLCEQSSAKTSPAPSSSKTLKLEDKRRKHSSEDRHPNATSHQALSPQEPPLSQVIRFPERDSHSSESEPLTHKTQPLAFQPVHLRTRHRTDESTDFADKFLEETSLSSPSKAGSSSLENLPPESLSEEEIKLLVKNEKYCMSTESPQKAELLLHFGTSEMANTWLYFGHYIAGNPLCSTRPNAALLVIDPIPISSHEFFQSRAIDIPVEDGTIGNRGVEFHHLHVNQKIIWKRFLECKCEIQDPSRDVQGICVQGRRVNFSKGVGGDSSFFVYRYNPSTKYYNVIAHICF